MSYIQGGYAQMGACPQKTQTLGLIPPESFTDWLVLGVIGFFGYKFFFDPHAGEKRRRRVRAVGRLGRMKAKKLFATNPGRRRRRRR